MGAICCHGNQSSYRMLPKSSCSQSPTPMMLLMKFDYNWPAGLRDIHAWKCGRMDGRRLESHTISLRLWWAKKVNMGWHPQLILEAFWVSVDFKKNSGKCQSVTKVWLKIRPDILLGLIWVKAACRGYQQMTRSQLAGSYKETLHSLKDTFITNSFV